jgi:hypothetical protein
VTLIAVAVINIEYHNRQEHVLLNSRNVSGERDEKSLS